MTIVQFIDLFFRKTLVPINSLRVKNNPSETTLINELRKKVKKIPLPNNADSIHNKWIRGVQEIKQDIFKKNPKNFLQWDVIRITMFIGNALFILREYLYLRQNNWNKWRKAIVEKKYVYTEPFILYPKSSGNFIHYAYHLAKFEAVSGKNIKDYDFIFEYGGGYAGMCLLIHNLGFRGKYIIYDFSILCALQSFFLKMNMVEKRVLCLYDINKVRKTIPRKGKGLFIATWSLSESPLGIRKIIYPFIKDFDAFLIGYQGQFNEINNRKYFKDYQKKLSKHRWWNQKIIQLKGNFYLFGYK